MMHHGLDPLDQNDPNDRACEKYRKRFLDSLIRLVGNKADKDRQADEFSAIITGTLVGIAQAMLSGGTTPEELTAAMEESLAFAVAQATNGAVISPSFILKHGRGGSA